MAIKRYLYLWHRWLGIALCLFMALWFISGVVMLFVGYPKLTPAEHLARLPALSGSGCCVDLDTVLTDTGRTAAPATLRLSTIAGTPFYLLGYAGESTLAINARTGQRLDTVDADLALSSARQFGGAVAARYDGMVQEDWWSRSRALDADRPLHRVQLDDDQNRLLYISSRTGEVVRDATRNERLWNWIGAWLHWLYPLRDSPWWADIVIYLSLAATAMAVLGQTIGLLRWRFSKPYRSGSRSPYAGNFARWHHIGGLLFGLMLIAWIFSGLMSMRPWHLLESRSLLSLDAYRGGELRGDYFPLSTTEVLNRFHESGLQASEMEWRMVAGKGYVAGIDRAGNSRVLSMEPQALPQSLLPMATLHAAAQAMRPDGRMTIEQLDNYDAYYYARAEQSMYGYQVRALPVLRVQFDDPQETWVYLDPRTGAVPLMNDRSSRFGRWLFNLLHSWDWQPLLDRPMLREILIIAFSAGGLVISVSGIVLGWRRLRRRGKQVRRSSLARVNKPIKYG